VAVLLAGAAGLVAAVILLRSTQGGMPSERTAPPPTIAVAPTTVARFADPGVVLPEPGPPPDTVGDVQSEAGDRMLRLRWAQAVSGIAPRGAAGFEVRWGRPGAPDRTMLVAAPELELRGLTNGERYDAEVRSVDAFGRRSAPRVGSGVPEPGPPDPSRATLTGLYDDFRTEIAPDPARWAVQRIGPNCLRAGPGSGQEDDRLVLDLRCGSAEAVLRTRVPLRLSDGLTDGPVFGRIMVITDGPIPGGELSISMVPGPVPMLGVAAGSNLPPRPEPGSAVEDTGLPPGTIRAVITASGAAIVTGPGVPRTPAATPTEPTAPTESIVSPTGVLASPGVTARWDLQLATDGVTLRRDGDLAASGDVRPNWQEATVLIGFAAPPGDSARVHVDAIGFSGEPSEPPNVVDVVGVIAGDTAYPQTAAGPSRRSLSATASAQSARLQVVAGPTARCVEDDLTADFEGPSLPLRPAVLRGAPARGPYCPLVADLTPELMDRLRGGTLRTPVVRSAEGRGLPVSGVLEVTYPPGVVVTREPVTDPPGPPPDGGHNRLAHLSAELRNAAGERLVDGQPVARGRVVLDVSLDGLAGQRETGELAGMAGIEVRLDNQLVAGLPTTSDGPAPAGNYQFALSASRLRAGSHVIELRVYGVVSGTRPRGLWLSFQIAPG
jgi:hypothetical protein